MHTIKGGWVGQTFALAKCNESDGRKSRIRRSKEERKAMVESFIKKYQTSNNGNFPSLNLTHKEVGGSFYTVREIVREIIQENRVLGPAKLIPEELKTNLFDEQHPLGSIAKEPEIALKITSDGSEVVPNHHQSASEEPVLISDELCSKHEKKFDNEGVINGSQVDVRIEESGGGTFEELQTSKPLDSEERVEKLAVSTAIVTPLTAEVEVETFPLRPVPKAADCSGARSGVENMNGTLEKNETEMVDLEAGNGHVLSDQNSSEMSDLLDEKKGESLENLVLDTNSGLVDKEEEFEVIESYADPQLNSLNCSTTGGTIGKHVEVEVSHNDVLTSDIYGKSQSVDGTKEINAANGTISSGTYGSSSRVESKGPNATVVESEFDGQHNRSCQKQSNPTLDRIKLESWDGASRNSAEKETNPLLAIVKSFITAFIKFWSE